MYLSYALTSRLFVVENLSHSRTLYHSSLFLARTRSHLHDSLNDRRATNGARHYLFKIPVYSIKIIQLNYIYVLVFTLSYFFVIYLIHIYPLQLNSFYSFVD